MSDDLETRRLRALIERPHVAYLWGRSHTITPRLIARKFGDGRQLVCIAPMMTRPNYFVARVDSSINDITDPFPPTWPQEFDLLDAIQDAQEEEYGYYDNEDDDGNRPYRGFPWIDWGDGCSWGRAFPMEEWKPALPPETGRQRTRAQWRRRGRR